MRFIEMKDQLVPVFEKTAGSRRISQVSMIPQPSRNPQFSFNLDLQHHLTGKQLLVDDIPFTLDEIFSHYKNGYLSLRKGIEYVEKKPICARCGNKESHWFASFPCARCQENCLYCRKCIIMGRISECTPLIGWIGPAPECKQPDHILDWNGSLSDGQRTASDDVVQAIRQNQEWLVWAVCGAGKTEVLFHGIETALLAGKRVCIATPRTDVVLELTPRLKAAFPQIEIAALYGGSEDRHLHAPLTIATTHQLLRFYQAFDTMILDEVDAFPYTVDESLKFAAGQARKPLSSMIYLTATPNEKWQRECKVGKRNYTTIPARYHRYSLPVPEWRWCGNWKRNLSKGKLPKNIIYWLNQRLHIQKQALLFFPQIPSMEKALPLLKNLHPHITSVHASDPNRKEKIMQMRANQIPVLLTTTILERGVTLPNIDVAVIGAEEDVFTESALVQIAGRAGRSALHPKGTVTFFHYGRTNAMWRAKKQIQAMNREARRKGLIDQ